MKICVTQKMFELGGKEARIVIQACRLCGRPVEDQGTWTLRRACVDALLAQFRDEENLDGSEKVARYDLALRISKEDTPDLGAEEIVTVKKLVGKMLGPLIVGQAWAMLDPKG